MLGLNARDCHLINFLPIGDREKIPQGLFLLNFAAWVGQDEMKGCVMDARIAGPFRFQFLLRVQIGEFEISRVKEFAFAVAEFPR